MKRREFLGAVGAGAVAPLADQHEWKKSATQGSGKLMEQPADEVEQTHCFQLFGTFHWLLVTVYKSGKIDVLYEDTWNLKEQDGWYVLKEKHKKAKVRRVDDKTIEIETLAASVPHVKPMGTERLPDPPDPPGMVRLQCSSMEQVHYWHWAEPGLYRMTSSFGTS